MIKKNKYKNIEKFNPENKNISTGFYLYNFMIFIQKHSKKKNKEKLLLFLYFRRAFIHQSW